VAELADRFFAEEADEYVQGVLDRELESRVSGSRYFTFNVFNVRLDFDEGVATIEDELDPASSESLSLEELRTRLAR
jgi:hypothetical protein